MVPFFRLEINNREMSSYYLRRPALGVGYVLKSCPDKFSDVLGLKECVCEVHKSDGKGKKGGN